MTQQKDDALAILSAYLHQDWKVQYPTPRVALLRLLRDEPPEITDPLIGRVRELVAGSASEAELDSLLNRFVDYAYGRDGMSARQFLADILRVADGAR